MRRRDFLWTATAATGAGAALVARGATAPTGTPRAGPAAPAAPAAGGLVFDLGATPATTFPGGALREQTATNFPASPTIAAALMDLEPGGLRGFHWHRGGAEYGTVISGRLLLTVLDDQNRQEVGPVGPGDVYYVPRGFGHALACLGEEPCRVLATYDDGATVESNALNLTDWVATQRPDILSTVLGVPGPELIRAANGVPLLAAGPVRTDPSPPLRGDILPAPASFRFAMTGVAPDVYPGGSFVQASVDQFKNSRSMVGAFTRLTRGGVREPHWHPNADEWDFVLAGRARVTFFDGGRVANEVELGPGQVGFLPRYQAHAVENLGDDDFYLFSVFNADSFQAIDITPALMTLPADQLATNLGLPPETIARLPVEPRFIFR